MKICNEQTCTGCGMCVNICPKQSIELAVGEHGFMFPIIDENKCVSCGLCKKKCPANNQIKKNSSIRKIYAVWNRNKTIRQKSTSGGVFSLLAENVLKDNGLVAGVKWNDDFKAIHYLIDNLDDLQQFYGSKYVQSFTGKIYIQIKQALEKGKKVLFSGTPCQNHALRLYLGKEYSFLFQIDLICHGIPSDEMLKKYLNELKGISRKNVRNIQFRYKSPYWDFSNVMIEYSDGSKYSKPTVDDSYFTLFNIGYSLRNSCHRCQYTNLNRQSDITLSDFWTFSPHNLKMCNYNHGVSCVLINSEKGKELFDKIGKNIVYEERSLEEAKRSNQSLSKPFGLPQEQLDEFWLDYSNMTVEQLFKKYVPHPFKIPKYMWLRRLKRKYQWIVKK